MTPKHPQAGGSYVREPTGKLVRKEGTIQLGEPGHGQEPGAAAEPPANPAAQAPADTARKRR